METLLALRHEVWEWTPPEAQAYIRALERSEEHTSELQSPCNLVCRLLLEKKKKKINKSSRTIQSLQTKTDESRSVSTRCLEIMRSGSHDVSGLDTLCFFIDGLCNGMRDDR